MDLIKLFTSCSISLAVSAQPSELLGLYVLESDFLRVVFAFSSCFLNVVNKS